MNGSTASRHCSAKGQYTTHRVEQGHSLGNNNRQQSQVNGQVPNELSNDIYDAMLRVANERDKGALLVLSNYFANRILSFAYQKTGDEQLAKEIVQDTLFAVWQKAHTFNQDKGNITTWIYTIARNLCFDAGRKKLSRPQLVSGDVLYQDIAPENGSTDSDHINQLDNQKIILLLNHLPQSQREVISLVYLNEFSHYDAAKHMKVPVGTIKSRLRLALNKLATLAKKEAFGYE